MSNSVLELVSEIKAARIERTRPVPVHRLTGSSTELLPPGSGVFVVASLESDLFRELDHALSQNDHAGVNDVTNRVKPSVAGLTKVEVERAVEELRATPTFADLHFGTKPVAINVFTVPGIGFTRVFFPFVGGDFDQSEFRLTEYAISETDQRLQALVVVHEPPLSPREQEVINSLPEESRGMIFGPADPIAATPAALVATVAVGVLVAVVGTALTSAIAEFDRLGSIVLTTPLDQNATLAVQQLLAARRAALTSTSI
jgi:hypothetical protein